MKRTIILLSLIGVVLLSSSCTPFERPPERELLQEAIVSSELTAEEQLPSVTSQDAELYVMRNDSAEPLVVNPFGAAAKECTIDENGNIIGPEGRILVPAGYAAQYEEIESLKFYKEEYSISLDPLNQPLEYYYSGQYAQYSVPFVVSLEIEKPSATNHIIVIESSNPQVVSVRANHNAGLIADGSFDVPNGSIALQQKEDSTTMEIVVSAKAPGDAVLTAKALTGTASAECIIHVEYGAGNLSGIPEEWVSVLPYNTAAHVHSYTSSVEEPTLWETGYTLFTCEECGHSYKGEYVPKQPKIDDPAEKVHVHQYTASTVAPTDTERGYTLYTCHECGDSYKANYVKPTG